MSTFWAKKRSRSLKKLEYWSLTREFFRQDLTEKQTGYLQSGRLQEMFAYETWSQGES